MPDAYLLVTAISLRCTSLFIREHCCTVTLLLSFILQFAFICQLHPITSHSKLLSILTLTATAPISCVPLLRLLFPHPFLLLNHSVLQYPYCFNFYPLVDARLLLIGTIQVADRICTQYEFNSHLIL